MSTQVVDALKVAQGLTVHQQVAQAQGEGMAYQVVAQASASAVADASNYLRNISALSVAAMAAMTTRMTETGDAAAWQDAMQQVQQTTRDAADVFKDVGETSAKVLTAFKNL
jgi:hypothetical protein